MSTIYVSPSKRLYGDCDGHYPGKTLGELTDERVFILKKRKEGHLKPNLLKGKYADDLGWISD